MTSQEAVEFFKRYRIKKGDTIYGIIRHVSDSGMSRRISFYAIKQNKPVWLDAAMEGLGIGKRRRGSEGIVVSGCGMDMVFWCVYELGSALSRAQGRRSARDTGYDFKKGVL